MTELISNNTIRLASADALNLYKTFECGQCFRWNADGRGVYTGVAFSKAARLWTAEGCVFTDADEADVKNIWHAYFDLDRDYEKIRSGFNAQGDDYLAGCVDFGRGIRILRQDPWEALCSFIISQCNNIKRIKGIVETLCREFGEKITHPGGCFYSFPDAETVAGLSLSDLAALRCGYRAPYILNAAKAVASGGLDLKSLSTGDSVRAMRGLRSLEGVGEKVANCVMLFGLNRMDAFPVDVWMKRALDTNFPPDFDPETLGPYAGLMQQYIFFYERNRGRKSE